MALTNEDLLAISQLLDVKLKPMDRKIDRLDERIGSLEDKVEKLDERIGSLEDKVIILEGRAGGVETRMKKVELLLENHVLPRLQNIESCYVSTYKRYAEGTEQLEKMQVDIDILKKVVSSHSEMLQKLA